MKQISILFTILLIVVVFSGTLSFSDQDIVCIDPGHGGPGANKYSNGGDGHGGAGPVLGIAEQWVNFQVAVELYDLIQNTTFYNVLMTRTSEADTNIPTDHWQNLWYRANKANYGDNGNPVDYFISIHHNGLEPEGRQGTEVFWTSTAYTDSNDPRIYGVWRPAWDDSVLAMKMHFRLLDWWHYPDLCSARCGGGSQSQYCCNNNYFVLRNTVMPSALTEASNLNDAVEESLFNDPEAYHVEAEAYAIFEGWESHRDNMGIVTVRNSYSLGGGGQVAITDDWSCDNGDTVASPYVRCWLFGEIYCLSALTPQNISGYEYAFHHWTHLDAMGVQIGDDWYDPDWRVTVPAEYDYHRYVAYFTGGPYSAQVVCPNGYEIWHPGEERTIEWDVSPGADSSTWVDVFLDRNGGNDGYPEQLLDSIPGAYYPGWDWAVTPPYSTHCRIKVVAQDIAGNCAEDVSNIDFIISDSGNNDPVIESHIYCKYPSEECGDCVHFGESVTIQVDASDPDGDSIFYDWYVAQGHFAENGQHTITTAQNYVTYVAPVKGKEGGTVPFEDFISVAVTDVRGGQTCTEGHPELYDEPYSCLCGDANGTSVVNTADPVYILNYLYRGDDPPSDPMLRGDANNNCEIDMGDAIRILNWLFLEGDCPECCWFPPEGQVIVEASR